MNIVVTSQGLILKAEQLPLFGRKGIKASGKNYLGSDKQGRAHWRAHEMHPSIPPERMTESDLHGLLAEAHLASRVPNAAEAAHAAGRAFVLGQEAKRREKEDTAASATSTPGNLPPLIHSYTRAQAIEDGELVDLTEWASHDKGFRGGFQLPVAATRAVWGMVEAIPESKSFQDVRGRAHDLLFMASIAARGANGSRRVGFEVLMDVKGTRKRKHQFVAHLGAGDKGEPVLTIMRPGED